VFRRSNNWVLEPELSGSRYLVTGTQVYTDNQ
jgi:hypothetical protein